MLQNLYNFDFLLVVKHRKQYDNLNYVFNFMNLHLTAPCL